MQFKSHRANVARHLTATLLAAALAPIVVPAHAQSSASGPGGTELVPTGVFVSPTAIPGSTRQLLTPTVADWPSNLAASEAVKSQLSPDGNTLAILTAGYNDVTLTSGSGLNTQFIFIYDVSGANKTSPALLQVITQHNAFVGLVWNGNQTLYATGGADDEVYVYARASAAPSAQFAAAGTIALGHNKIGLGVSVGPNAGGLALTADGKTLVVANNSNDSITVIDTATNAVVAEYDLRPYNTSGQNGVAGGEYPYAVAIKADGKVFVSSIRDREVVVLDLSTPASPNFVTRIKLSGNAYGLTFSRDQSKLFVTEENADRLAVIDTVTLRLEGSIDTRAPRGLLGDAGDDDQGNDDQGHGLAPRLTGADPINVTLSPDGATLYVVNNGSNSIAVIPLKGDDAYTVTGLIPTGYAPKDITFSADGREIYIINGKSNTGPNPGYDFGGANQYQFTLEKASLVTAPVPTGRALEALTAQVAKNNFYSVPELDSDARVMSFIHDKIKHVIYITKENRAFDQILGDLTNGANGDPSITMFGASITPSFHALATNFVTLDNFMDPGDASMDGWSFQMRGGITTMEELIQQLNYAGHGLNDWEAQGLNRQVATGLLTAAERDVASLSPNVGAKVSYSAQTSTMPGGTANVLPGPADVANLDSPFGREASYIFDAVLHAGGTVRNYGWQALNIGPTRDSSGNPLVDPHAAGAIEAVELVPSLLDKTDLYYRRFDGDAYADTWRFTEWNREFQQFDADGTLPTLETVILGGDHMGSFGSSVAGLNVPEQQQADNDYAVGKVIEAVAHSRRYARNTVIIIVEDDSQDGPDHIDSHRSPAYVVGPYVKKHAVVSTRYSLISAVRTIEDILGTGHMNLNTRYTRPMSDVFDIRSSPSWTFDAIASTVLQGTGLQDTLNNLGAKYAQGRVVKPTHDAAYWAK
ncbi:MAG: beta-propeller fold lactonase family protein, partial [Polyangiaceae bacterium]|nr:beta-propeller fold lactonase family protein [Polyangiaceae bacterium]